MTTRESDLIKTHEKIINQYSDVDHFKAIQESSNIGREVFNVKDLYIKNPLDRLLRFFFIKKHITWRYLKLSTNNWYRATVVGDPNTPVLSSITSSKQNSNWSNIQKTVLGKKFVFGMSFRSLSEILSDILGWCIVDVKISLRHVSSKEECDISLSDIETFLKNHKKDTTI